MIRTSVALVVTLLSISFGAGQDRPKFGIEIGSNNVGGLSKYVNKTVTPILTPGIGKPPKPGSITIVSGFGMNPSYYRWIGTMLAGKKQGTACAIITLDSTFHEVEKLHMDSASIDELRIPALDSKSHDYGRFLLKIEPGQQTITNPTSVVFETDSAGVTWRKSDFKLEIHDIDCSRVTGIAPIALHFGSSKKSGTLTISVPRGTASDFRHWLASKDSRSGKLRISNYLTVAFQALKVKNVVEVDSTTITMTYEEAEASGPES